MKRGAEERSLKILALEPFGARGQHAGSHRAFLDGWQAHSRHSFHVLELPGLHWKWRSRHAAVTFAEQAAKMEEDGRQFDLVFCSDMLNVAEWRGLCPKSFSQLPTTVYFHENQFTYPVAPGQQIDYHLAYNNVLSILAADVVWFNSEFHRKDFSEAADRWLRRMPDFQHREQLREKINASEIRYPGIGDALRKHEEAKPLRIGWVARWEHDKRPDLFLELVQMLLDAGISFELILLGQQYQATDESMAELERIAQIHHSGHTDTRQQYLQLLTSMDVVVSTADHEFFGIGIVEAIASGAVPLLPNRLAYPEVLAACGAKPENYLYDDLEEAVAKIVAWEQDTQQRAGLSTALDASVFHWSRLAKEHDAALVAIAEQQ